jgi:hypothetical protein
MPQQTQQSRRNFRLEGTRIAPNQSVNNDEHRPQPRPNPWFDYLINSQNAHPKEVIVSLNRGNGRHIIKPAVKLGELR